MKTRRFLAFTFVFPAFAQLTTDQRIADFRTLAGTIAQYYAPYEWKRDLLKFDALDTAPWIERIRNQKDDLAFYDLCAEYISRLNDAHDYYRLPSTFGASLGFTVDIYEGKVLIDSIDRDRLPADTFKFEIGDELISVDGKPVEELIKAFEKYSAKANPLSTRRSAAARLTVRSQAVMPRAHEIGENAELVVRRASGDQETYSVAWRKTGVPVTGLVPGRGLRAVGTRAADAPGETSPHRRLLPGLQDYVLPDPPAVLGSGGLSPIFNLPEGFVVRLGSRRFDSYYSGTFEAEGLKIGYIRIPDFGFRSRSDFEKEIAYFQENTDGLIIDVMRNPGGSGCTAETLLARVIPFQFRALTEEFRVVWSDLLSIQSELEKARRDGRDSAEVKELEWAAAELEFAYRENGGRTRALPLCGDRADLDPAADKDGKMIAYTKPLMLLVDEMTASAGDLFAAVIQDNKRGILFGMRTMGAGGGAVSAGVGLYSEGQANITRVMLLRKEPVATPDYPTSAYLENIGVRPDAVQDYMTRENLMTNGRGFVQAFTTRMVEHINANRQ